jgi:hypothetical protein
MSALQEEPMPTVQVSVNLLQESSSIAKGGFKRQLPHEVINWDGLFHQNSA